MAGVLSGIVVLDLTQQLVGPGGTMLLGDLGADVIHVEPPPQPAAPGTAIDRAGRMRATLNFNRNKRSISVDATTRAGRAIIYRIAERADACVQNYRPGVAERLELDYEHIRAVNPSIVYCRVNAFGHSGPDMHRVGFDIIAQGGGGSMMPDRRDPMRPAPQPAPIGDVTGMCLLALATVSALYHRKVTGQGQLVQTSMLHGVVLQNILRLVSIEDEDRGWRQATVEGVREMARNGASYGEIMDATATGIGGLPTGSDGGGLGVVGNVYYRTYRTADGHLVIGCLNFRQQQRLNEALGLGDPRFEPGFDLQDPGANARLSRMQDAAEAIFASRTTDDWIAFLDERSIACGRVLNLLEVFDDPHHQDVGSVFRYEDPWVGPVAGLGHPIQFGTTPAPSHRPASPVGYDSEEILAWLGYDRRAIDGLVESGVVFPAKPGATPGRRGEPA